MEEWNKWKEIEKNRENKNRIKIKLFGKKIKSGGEIYERMSEWN